MMFRGLFSQIVTVLLAIGIAFFYIEPTFNEIGKMQDDMALYQQEREKVDAVNTQLSALVSGLNSVEESDQRKLVNYIPDEVDPIAVPRLLQIIANQAGLLFNSFGYDGVDFRAIQNAENSAVKDYPVPHTFTISVEGTYGQIKNMLELMERNEYPLEVHNLDIKVLEGNFLSADMTVITYSHVLPEESKFQNF